MDLLQELPFYDELNIYEISKAFGWYARSYEVETSKSSIKYLFRDLNDKIKGFKYQITVKGLLRKDKQNGGIEFAPVYFNSSTKTVINFKYDLDKSFQEVLNRTDN